MRNRLGAFVTLIGAFALLIVVNNFPTNEVAAFLGVLIILLGVGIRVL